MNQESFYEQQKNGQWKTLIAPLKNNPEIKSHFNDFIATFYWKFREKKGVNKEIHPKVIFQGFDGFQDFPSEGKMGHCEAKDLQKHWQTLNGQKVAGSEYWEGKILIVLNQKLLLDRLGMDKWFSSERSYLSVGFEETIATIAHELSHAHQYIINIEKEQPSQCESTGKRDANGNLLHPELAAEHTQFTAEIKSLIESSSEYQEFKKWWEVDKKETNQQNQKQCLYCKKYFPELIENKSCEDCAKKNTSYSCKICGEKFSLDTNLSFQEAQEKAHRAWKNHENQTHGQGNKCIKCGKVQGREDFYLATDAKTKQRLGYYCESCKDKLEQKEEKWEHLNVRKSPSSDQQNSPTAKQPHPDNERKWGQDFGHLKPLQREGRIKTQNSWSNQKNISFICLYCQKLFPYDKTMENYLEARNKALGELNTHKKSCSLREKESVKTELQNFWDKARKSKQRIIKTCEKCWGKLLWDKSIKDAETARQQALSDLKYHQKECGLEVKKKIAIYHSPNNGGNEHAPIDNFLTDDGVYLFDNEGEVYQEQVQESKKSYWPWIIGGLVGLGIIGLIVFLVRRQRKSE